ncbi:hypothetical protein JL721_2424 [Aureococcus anophagefferens]|nr:hypothetical protein JL721_2424 [Aureococcus anophagefferens]
MARTESRAYDAYFDPVWATAGGPKAPAVKFDAAAMSGSGRYKFFQRPMVPHLDAVAPGVLLAPTAEATPLDDAPESRVRDATVQTKYRESEAQTDPYSPEYVIPPGESPQILMLKGLSHERGLPAGEQEEMREFRLRQREMDEAHEERLDLLRQALVDRDQDNEFLAEQRVEALRQRQIEERDRSVEQIQSQRIKVLRKLSMARGRLQMPASEPPGSKRRSGNRDIISEYGTYSSRVYAPIARLGQRPDKDGEVTKPENENEATARTSKDRHKQQLAADLLKMNTILATKKEIAEDPEKAKKDLLPSWRTRVSKAERPPTPRVEPRDEDAEVFDMAVKLFQRLIRGRAVQNQMYEGKERRLELIRELRAADEARAAETDDDAAADARSGAEVAAAENRAAVARAAMGTIAGEMASSMLDFLSKELVRREEKERLKALAQRADNERRQREAEEAGRRQAEERLRGRSDEVYKQVMAAHLGAARTFVDEILEASIDDAARRQAIVELQSDDGLNAAMADSLRGKSSALAAEVVNDAAEGVARDAFVKDLVASFLTPSVELMQQKGEDRDAEKHLADAAQKALTESITEITRNPH